MIMETDRLKVCSWQAGDPGEMMVEFQPESKVCEPGELIVILVWNPAGPRPRKS